MRKKRQEHTTAIGSRALSAITAPRMQGIPRGSRGATNCAASDLLKFTLHRELYAVLSIDKSIDGERSLKR